MRWVVAVVIGIGLIFTVSVSASEGIISPIADDHAAPDNAPAIVSDEPLRTSGEPSLLAAVHRFLAMESRVLPAETGGTPPPQPSVSPSPTSTPAPVTRTARKSSFTIVLLGDSMVDTLGPDGAGLESRLQSSFPSVSFSVINHGVGAENIDSGLRRLTGGYTYLGEARKSVVAENPDIIVLESFGYNPYPLPDLTDAVTKHWLRLAEIVDTARRELPETKIVIAATIAPNWDVFGDGAPFINMSPEGKRIKVEEIKTYIESTIAFANSQNLPLADAYRPSLGPDGNGKLTYINGGDHIHYSESGRALMAQKIADAIITNNLIE